MDFSLSLLQLSIVFSHFPLFHPKLYFRYAHKVLDVRSPFRFLIEHPIDNVLQVLRVSLRNTVNIPLDNFLSQREVVSCLEGWPQGYHLVQNATK
jgi:hypothetical protein